MGQTACCFVAGIDRIIYCQDIGRFLGFSFAVGGFWTACHIPVFLPRLTALRGKMIYFPVAPCGQYPHGGNPYTESPHTDNPFTGKPFTENPAQLNTK